jgi:hypothetical protein
MTLGILRVITAILRSACLIRLQGDKKQPERRTDENTGVLDRGGGGETDVDSLGGEGTQMRTEGESGQMRMKILEERGASIVEGQGRDEDEDRGGCGQMRMRTDEDEER